MTREQDAVIAERLFGGSRKLIYTAVNGRVSAGVPRYTSEANADYLVLEKVRETWGILESDRFIAALQVAWFNREMPRLAATHRPILYEPGDYSRAVLAVWESET